MGYEDFLKRSMEMRKRSVASLQERQALLAEMDSTLKDVEIITGHMQMIADESARVAEVAANAEQILDEIDEKFEKCTGLNKQDVSFLFLAVALQVVRQYTLTKFPERLDDKTAANNTKGHVKEKSDRKHRYYNPSLTEICGSKELGIPPDRKSVV